MKLVFLGAPGAGKGTQAQEVCRHYNIPQISTGDLLRDAVGEGSDLGKQAKGYMNSGQLVPDELVIKLLEERLQRPDCQGGYILDGFPRSIGQAEALETIAKLDAVIFLDVPENVLVKRLTGRRICPKCNAIFHVLNNPPSKEGVCDKCGADLIQRDDDTEATVLKRLDTYKQSTMPLIKFYEGRGLLKRIIPDIPEGGDADIEAISNSIIQALSN